MEARTGPQHGLFGTRAQAGPMEKEEVITMAEKEKRVMAPLTNVMHTEDDSGLRIEVDLAGALKDSIELEMGSGGFCVKAEAEGVRYESCFMLAHEVRPKEAKARFDSGLLIIEAPFKESVRGFKVPVH